MKQQSEDEMGVEMQEVVERCRALRRDFEGHEVEFFEGLFAVMQESRDVWGVCVSFEAFLEKHVGRPNPSKWTNYCRARERVGVERIREIGVNAAIEAAKIEDPKRRETFVAETREWSRQHDGVHASEEHARDKRRDIDPRPGQETPALNRLAELVRLRAENAELRAQLRATQRRCEQAEKEVARMKAAQGGARKPGPKHANP